MNKYIKTDWSLLPKDAIERVIKVFQDASLSGKHERFNWYDEQISFQEHFAKAQRHQWDWLVGKDLDEDSGMLALAHAIADLLIILDSQVHQLGLDDRDQFFGLSSSPQQSSADTCAEQAQTQSFSKQSLHKPNRYRVFQEWYENTSWK